MQSGDLRKSIKILHFTRAASWAEQKFNIRFIHLSINIDLNNLRRSRHEYLYFAQPAS